MKMKDFNIEQLTQKYPMFSSTYEYLVQKHSKHELTVSETLDEIGMSLSDFYEKKKRGQGIPSYRQKSHKSRITFPIVSIALFLSQDFIKVDK